MTTWKSLVRPDAQSELLDLALQHRRPADDDRLGEALVDDDLHRAQHALVLAFGKDDPLRILLGRGEDRLHQQAGVIDELQQPLAVRREIRDRARRHAGVHRRLGDRGRDHHDEARIERLRDQVLGTEVQILLAVRVGDDVRLLRHREIGERPHRRELHRLVHRRGADVERAAEDERKAQHVVDLVREVRAPRRDDGVRPRRLGDVRHDLGLGIGERQDQRLVGHPREPLGLQHLRRRKAEKDVGAVEDVGELARLGRLRVARLVVVHLLAPAAVDDAGDVGDPDVLLRYAEQHEEVEARERRGAGARADELDVLQAPCRRRAARS